MKLSLKDYIFAGYPGIVYNTPDEEKALEECYEIAELTNRKLYVWNLKKGVYQIMDSNFGTKLIKDEDQCPPDGAAIKEALELNNGKGNIIYCMLDFHPFIKSPEVWRSAKDAFQEAQTKLISYVFISHSFELPPELEHKVISISMELPDKEELRELLHDLCQNFMMEKDYIPSKKELIAGANAALGLTLFEAENAFATSLSKKGCIDVAIINDVKRRIICKDGLLEYQESNESLETIGGMHEFTNYAMERLSAYSEEAQEYGLPYPKGVLLIGIPGCGKSLAAKALSNMWKEPLVKLDLGKLFGSYVGDTERNTRRALQIAESMAPCILWLDEIDKGLSGANSSGKNDSGVASRMFGTILTWLQEKKVPVYVIATANNISNLPPELLRKGRFDEILFVNLPSLEERIEIFEIQIRKHKGDPKNFKVKQLAEFSDGYNGAEIEECIVAAMFKAWNDGHRPYKTEDIEAALQDIKPASKGIMAETVKYLKDWSQSHSIRSANGKKRENKEEPENVAIPKRGKRTITALPTN